MLRSTFLVIATGLAYATNLDDMHRLSFTGLGPVRIGMTESQVRKILSGKVKTEKAMGSDCYYMNPTASGLGFMMLSSRVARIDVFKGSWRSVSGAGIGSTEEQVKKMYGDLLSVKRHKYDDKGHYLIVRPRDPTYKGYEMRFETDGKIVRTFRSGLAEAVLLVEGCS
ncbi:MAG TPA: hypothetical protein VEX68_09620 [Bryobacteraceae bacterium]|nr:hypothetical protein [Bryobacteraceae bacterium]